METDELFTITARRCKRCGGLLTSDQGIRDGYGQCCLKKMQEEQARKEMEKYTEFLKNFTDFIFLEDVLELADMVLVMTVNPGFGGQKYIPYCTEKIRRLRKMAQSMGKKLDIEVDGGINRETVHTVLEAGANVIVAGSAVFGGDTRENAKALKGIIEEYESNTGLRR